MLLLFFFALLVLFSQLKTISKSSIVPYSSEQMYALVNDVKRYPEFVLYTKECRVLERLDDSVIARLTIAKGGLKHSFTTHNFFYPYEKIEMKLVDGPFSHLEGLWQFKTLNESHCKVSLDMKFHISDRLLRIAFGPLFTFIASNMMETFIKRAGKVYGK